MNDDVNATSYPAQENSERQSFNSDDDFLDDEPVRKPKGKKIKKMRQLQDR